MFSLKQKSYSKIINGLITYNYINHYNHYYHDICPTMKFNVMRYNIFLGIGKRNNIL